MPGIRLQYELSSEFIAREMRANPELSAGILMELSGMDCVDVFSSGMTGIGGQQRDAVNFLRRTADAIESKS